MRSLMRKPGRSRPRLAVLMICLFSFLAQSVLAGAHFHRWPRSDDYRATADITTHDARSAQTQSAFESALLSEPRESAPDRRSRDETLRCPFCHFLLVGGAALPPLAADSVRGETKQRCPLRRSNLSRVYCGSFL